MKIIRKVKLTMQEVISKMKSKSTTESNPFRYFTLEQLEKLTTASQEKRKEIEAKLKDLESIFDDITKTYNEKIESIGDKISQNKKRR